MLSLLDKQISANQNKSDFVALFPHLPSLAPFLGGRTVFTQLRLKQLVWFSEFVFIALTRTGVMGPPLWAQHTVPGCRHTQAQFSAISVFSEQDCSRTWPISLMVRFESNQAQRTYLPPLSYKGRRYNSRHPFW